VQTIFRRDPPAASFEGPLSRVLVTRNDVKSGLGLALPAGKIALFGREDGHRLLIGEGRIDDRAVGDKVETVLGTATGIRARQTPLPGPGDRYYRLVVSNDEGSGQDIEVRLPLSAVARTGRLVTDDGRKLWRVRVPANGTRTLVYTWS